MLKRLGRWFYDRLGLETFHRAVFDHEIPPQIGRSRKGWYYVFGQALVFTFLLQVITGTALATNYIASPADAWESLRFLNEEVAWGWYVRALHFFGASAMVILVFVHMARVFLTGSFKFPREMNWITGVILLFLVLAMAFTGQLLRWDQDGVWTVMVAANFAGRVPLLGEPLMQLILGGATLGGATLSRFFTLHVIVFPLLIFAVMGYHVYLVLHHGVSEPPEPGRRVDPETYKPWYEKLIKEGETPYWPHGAWREFVFITVVFAVVFGLAWIYGPKGPGPPADPAEVIADPRPDWYFLWYYALIWFKPRELDEVVLVWLPLVAGLLLLLVPLVFNKGERAPQSRPWAVLVVALAALGWGLLTAFGARPYWVPAFDTERPPAAVAAAPSEVEEGAHIFLDRGCQYCHRVLGHGGGYGPDLSDVALRMSHEEVSVRIVMGIRNMPAYRDILTTEELDRVLAYLAWAAGEQAPLGRVDDRPERPGRR